MHYKTIVCLSVLLSNQAFAGTAVDEVQPLLVKAKTIFTDNFNRSETDNKKEQLDNEWRTNSKTRAKGVKQADLKDGALYITIAKEADHAVSVLRTAPFDDGIVRVKFKMLDNKGLKFNFNDPKARDIAHAGHVASVDVRPYSITIVDQLTGIFKHEINKVRKTLDKKALAKLLVGKSASFKQPLNIEQWYELTIVIRADVLTVYIDNEKIGSLQSAGIDHQVKDNIAFSVAGKAAVDDLTVWSLD